MTHPTRAHRDAILARRTAFIASALGAALVSSSVWARPSPGRPAASCPDWRASSVEDQALSDSLLAQALEQRDAGEYIVAYELLVKARGRAPSPAVLLELARMAAALGRGVESLDTVETVLSCAGMTPEQRQDAVRLRDDQARKVGQLSIATDLADVEIYVDDVLVGNAPLPFVIRVLPGHHSVTAVRPGVGEVARASASVAGGQSAEVSLVAGSPNESPDESPDESPALVPPQPSLQVCLSVRPPESHLDRRSLAPGVAIAPLAFVSTLGGDSHHYGGVGLSVFLNYGITDSVAWRGSIYGAPSGSSAGFLSPAAIHNALRFQTDWIGVAIGVSTGYLYLPQPSRAAQDDFEPLSGFFVQPELSASLLALGRFELEPKVGVVLSSQDDVDSTRFSASFVTAGLWVSYVWYEESTW